MMTLSKISGWKAWQNIILDLMDDFDVEKLLERRDKVILHVISRKVLSGIPVEDLNREKAMKIALLDKCASLKMTEYSELILCFWSEILKASRNLQVEIVANGNLLKQPYSLKVCRNLIDEIDHEILIVLKKLLHISKHKIIII